ncbi:MAG: hypothetical protein P8R42_13530 [Candidatus Binatia bacterium]|nr:hypothetical protein [Candidatus Binatia bacterium]
MPIGIRRLAPASIAMFAALLLACGSGSGGSQTSTSAAPQPTPAATPAAPTGETLGFVISSFGYLYPQHDGEVCPLGFNWAPGEFANDGQPIEDDCLDPEAGFDPRFQSLLADGSGLGFDLDGHSSSANAPAAGECAHDDFSGPGGESGYDFNLWRVLGCIRGHQPGEIADTIVDNSVRDGSSTILIEVSGVDDVENDESVTVRVFASTDAPATAADGSLLPFGTLSTHADARYHGTVASGAIVDGVVTAGPTDFRWRLNIQIVETDLSLKDAYVRLEIGDDGTASGQFVGYTGIDEMYEIFGKQAGQAGAAALGYTCTGLWSALQHNADGDYNPATGTCSSVSAAYRFEAVPAFVAK